MSGVPQQPVVEDGPAVEVTVASRSATEDPGTWDFRWAVRNLSGEALALLAAWLPHGRFRSPRREIEPPTRVEPGGQVEIELAVQAKEPPGTVVENCFVI